MTDGHLVSVIIPSYNRADVLGRSIKSVLNQTYQNFEILVIDDHSTDSSFDVIKKSQRPIRASSAGMPPKQPLAIY